MFKKLFAAALIAVSVAGCAGLQQNIEAIQKRIDLVTGVFDMVTDATVPANVVIPAANAFDILKAAATNYGSYCIGRRQATGAWPAVCSADIRRNVIRSVRAGTAARNQIEESFETGQPVLGSVYNILVSAVRGLKGSPANTEQFGGVK